MRRPATALALPVLLLALTGCLAQPEEANDNPDTRSVPSPPPGVVRTPEPVESAELEVEVPGPTRSPGG